MKKIVTIVLVSILVLWVIINVFSTINLSFFGIRIYRVGSSSMEPSLQVDDLILVKEEKNYKVGDIITYKEDKGYITHRIVKIENDMVTTKGDKNDSEDKSIVKKDIIGKFIYKFKILTLLRYMMEEKSSWIIIFAICILVIFVLPVKTKE